MVSITYNGIIEKLIMVNHMGDKEYLVKWFLQSYFHWAEFLIFQKYISHVHIFPKVQKLQILIKHSGF